MQKYNVDPLQAKTYITNNRHNQVTAFYYLMEIKAKRDPNFQLEDKIPEKEKIVTVEK